MWKIKVLKYIFKNDSYVINKMFWYKNVNVPKKKGKYLL
jgi:hypothetical protein